MYNHAPPGYDCPFCAYGRGVFSTLVQEQHVVERTAETLSFVSPKWWINNPGHVIVIPISHHENIYDLTDDAAASLASAVRRAAIALKSASGCDGTSTRQHNEAAGNQEVWHLHVHVFPRYDGDQLYTSPARSADTETMDAYALRLRAAYGALAE